MDRQADSSLPPKIFILQGFATGGGGGGGGDIKQKSYEKKMPAPFPAMISAVFKSKISVSVTFVVCFLFQIGLV